MKNFINEFKEFALKGNVVSMAVGVIIGGAFQAIVKSLTEDIISPLIGLFIKGNLAGKTANFAGVELGYGNFLTAIINFFIMAFVLFIIVRAMNRLMPSHEEEHEPAPEPEARKCPYCFSEIDENATRCPSCTSVLDSAAPAE